MHPVEIARWGSIRLLTKVICPHCWHEFSPTDTLWISEGDELLGDPRLGDDQPLRFLPCRFNIDGLAIDPSGFNCTRLACPNCHLEIPRSAFESEPLFVSLFGSPASGKSYLLMSMTWTARQTLAQRFRMHLTDADVMMNQTLIDNETLHFTPDDPHKPVAIRKTEMQGELYDLVNFGDQVVRFPKPYLFSLNPGPEHPNYGKQDAGLTLVVYDNAGEHFQAGQDTGSQPGTRHLARSRLLMFVFDPTKDPRFRQLCRSKSSDPQLERVARSERQESILSEVAARVRRYAGLQQRERCQRVLLVLVAKFDIWASLLAERIGIAELPSPWKDVGDGLPDALDGEIVQLVSAELRLLLQEHCPEVVAAAEDFCETVLFLPVSALGCSPEADPDSGALLVTPARLAPVWTEVPLITGVTQLFGGLIRVRN